MTSLWRLIPNFQSFTIEVKRSHQTGSIYQTPFSSFKLKTRFVGYKNDKSTNNFAVISHMMLIFKVWIKMSNRSQMIIFKLN